MTTLHHETKSFIDMSGPDGPRLVQLPGLDGLRGVAVAAVVVYHMGFGWMVGGYLGVSTFFTLSGFLITSILLKESQRTGGVSLGRFWARRFRRLMPAAVVTLMIVVTLYGRTVATADQRLALRGDVVSSLLYVANWRFVLAGTSYGDLTSVPSPVLHFWSLSIEEQFYVLFPLLMLGLLPLLRRRRGIVAAILVGLGALSALAPWMFGMSVNRAYLGSDVRAVEILAGGLLAFVLDSQSVRRALTIRYQFRSPLMVLACIAGVIQLYWMVTVRHSSEWLYRGGLPLFAATTCVLIVASALPVGPFRLALGTPPMRWLGTRSYGIYLFHWPLLIAARQIFPDLQRDLRAIGAVAVALVAAEVSFRYIETPVRVGIWPSRERALPVAIGALSMALVIAVIPIPVDRSELTTDFESAAKELEAIGGGVAPSTSDSTTTTLKPAPPAVPKVSIFGDSTSVLASLGLAQSIKDGTTAQLAYSGGDSVVGCGVSRWKTVRLLDEAPLEPHCLEWPLVWTQSVSSTDPDVSMIITSAWELVDGQLPASGNWSAIGEPEADEFIRGELTEAVKVTSAAGALVVLWLWPPYASWADDLGRSGVARQHDPARMERLHQIMREVADAHPESVRIFDLGEFLGPERLADRSIRPDGLHIPNEKLTELFATGLSQRIHDIYTQWWYSQNP